MVSLAYPAAYAAKEFDDADWMSFQGAESFVDGAPVQREVTALTDGEPHLDAVVIVDKNRCELHILDAKFLVYSFQIEFPNQLAALAFLNGLPPVVMPEAYGLKLN